MRRGGKKPTTILSLFSRRDFDIVTVSGRFPAKGLITILCNDLAGHQSIKTDDKCRVSMRGKASMQHNQLESPPNQANPSPHIHQAEE
jgi:hypothetical protein